MPYGLDYGRMANPRSTIIIHYAALNSYFVQQGPYGGKRWAHWAVEIERGTKDDYAERFPQRKA